MEQEHKCKRTVALCMTEQWRLEMENGDRRGDFVVLDL